MFTFNNCCDVASLKFKLSCDKTTGYLRTIHFWGKKCRFHQMHEFCISQGTVATFFNCGGQIQKHLYTLCLEKRDRFTFACNFAKC